MSGKLTQILGLDGYLYALDESGEVWWLDGAESKKTNAKWKSVIDDGPRPPDEKK